MSAGEPTAAPAAKSEGYYVRLQVFDSPRAGWSGLITTEEALSLARDLASAVIEAERLRRMTAEIVGGKR